MSTALILLRIVSHGLLGLALAITNITYLLATASPGPILKSPSRTIIFALSSINDKIRPAAERQPHQAIKLPEIWSWT